MNAPDEKEETYLLRKIFHHLPHQDLLHCRLACLYWNKIISSWPYFNNSTIITVSDSFLQSDKQAWGSRIKALSFTKSPVILSLATINHNSLLNPLLFPELRTIHLFECYIDLDFLHNEIFKLNTLQELKIVKCFLKKVVVPASAASPETPTEEPVPHVFCDNISHLHLSMRIKDLIHVSKLLMPKLNQVQILKIEEPDGKEFSNYSRAKSPAEVDEDFYGFNSKAEQVGSTGLPSSTVPDDELQPYRHWRYDDSLHLCIQDFVKRNVRLKHLNISVHHSTHSFSIKEIVATLIKNKIQLSSLILNSFNYYLGECNTFGFNLIIFLLSQTHLQELTLCLTGMKKESIRAIQLVIPPTVEKLLLVPISLYMASTSPLLNSIRELEIPTDQYIHHFVTEQQGLEAAEEDEEMEIEIAEVSRTGRFFQDKIFPNLTSFKGQVYFSVEDMSQFCKSVPFLSKLDLDLSENTEDDFMPAIIEGLPLLVQLILRRAKTSGNVLDNEITGFHNDEYLCIEKMEKYPQILETLNVGHRGLSLVDLKFLEVYKSYGVSITDFGLYFGLFSTRLKILDLDDTITNSDVTEWGLNKLAQSSNNLQELRLTIGTKVSPVAMDNFLAKLPRLNYKASVSSLIHVRHDDAFKMKKVVALGAKNT